MCCVGREVVCLISQHQHLRIVAHHLAASAPPNSMASKRAMLVSGSTVLRITK